MAAIIGGGKHRGGIVRVQAPKVASAAATPHRRDLCSRGLYPSSKRFATTEQIAAFAWSGLLLDPSRRDDALTVVIPRSDSTCHPERERGISRAGPVAGHEVRP